MRVNLYPWRQARARRQVQLWSIIFLLILLISPGISYYCNGLLQASIRQTQRELTKTKTSITDANKQINSNLARRLQQLQTHLLLIKNTLAFNHQLLSQLTLLTQGDFTSLKLYALTIDGNQIDLKGYAKDEKALVSFLQKLSHTQYKQFNLKQTVLENSYAFELVATKEKHEHNKA